MNPFPWASLPGKPAFLGLLCLGAAGAAQAYTITLSPSTLTPTVGTQVTVDLIMDFTGETTAGGGIDIHYSFTDGTGLRFVRYDAAPGAVDFTAPDGLAPTPQSTKLLDLAFGYPTTSPLFGNDLPFDPAITVGTLTFDVLAAGSFSLSAAETTDPNGTAGFWSSTNQNKLSLVNVPVTLDAQGAAGLPVPGTAWLMLGGVAAAFARRR
jgi:hypothetical protein